MVICFPQVVLSEVAGEGGKGGGGGNLYNGLTGQAPPEKKGVPFSCFTYING